MLPVHCTIPAVLTGPHFLLRWDDLREGDSGIQQHLNNIPLPQLREDFDPEPAAVFAGRDVGRGKFHQLFGPLRMTSTSEELTLDLY